MPTDDFQIFLKLDEIDGESTDAQHAKEIEAHSYDHALSQPPAPPYRGQKPRCLQEKGTRRSKVQ